MAAANENRLMLTTRKSRSLELLDESLQILRTGGVDILVFHWIGSLPFAIALLWMLRDTGFAWAAPLMLRDSLLCAVAFLWLSYWRSVASSNTLTLLTSVTNTEISWPARLSIQVVFQTLKLFVMPLAIASLFAWPAASTFFRTLALEPHSANRPLRQGLQRAFSAASYNYLENVIAFLAVAALASVMFIDILAAVALLPTLWKVFTGYETDWSRLENSSAIFSLFSVAVIGTWFLIDPWLQTFSILRVFYRNARTDGRDLLRDLSRLVAVAVLCIACVGHSSAQPTGNLEQTREHTMNNAIQQVASNDLNYGWLHPPDDTAPTGFLGVLAKGVRDAYVLVRDRVRIVYQSFTNWLRDLFRDQKLTKEDLKNPKPRTQELRWILALLALLICGLIVAMFLRSGRIPSPPIDASAARAATPDVFDEKLLPSDVNQEEWMRLAFEYLANNQTRLAARAFYLANLSYLGGQSLLSLALWKSNRLYERELARHPKSSQLSQAFIAGNRLYERAWYGMRELAGDQMETLKAAADQLRHA